MNRDYHTGLELAFEPIFQTSDGHAMFQSVRAKPKRRRVTKERIREKAGGRVAIMQALRFHYGKTCTEIADLLQMTSKTRITIVSALTLGGSPECGLDWHRRRYKQEAIAAAQRLLEAE